MARSHHARFKIKAFLSQEGKGRTILRLRQKQMIFAQGDAGDAVFYVLEGRVKLTVVSRQGKEAIVAILKPGEFFGEACLDGQPRTATAVALEHCCVLQLKRSSMIEALRREPAFAEMFMAHLLARNARIEADLIDHLFNTSERRLARALLLLAHVGKEGGRGKAIPKISQETLAEMVGTTRGRVSFFMNKFRRLGFIDYNEGLHVHTALLNMVLRD